MFELCPRIANSSLRTALLATATMLALNAFAGSAPAQVGSGSGVEVNGTVEAGGGGVSQGGDFTVIGSIGQMGVDTMQGGSFDFSSGILLPNIATCEFADLNCDGSVDGADLGLLLVNWGPCPSGDSCVGDINENGVVDAEDLATLISSWS